MTDPPETCERDGCANLPTVAVTFVGTSITTGEPMSDDLYLCDGCHEVLSHSPTFTLNGIKMTRDSKVGYRAVDS